VKALRVLLADDHALVRAGIRELVQKIAGLEVVGEAGDGRTACKLVNETSPDLVLLDIAMKGASGLETAASIAREHPDVKIIMLSMYSNAEYVARALRAGASGYILKQAAADELESGIAAVLRGETYLSPAISRVAMDDCLTHSAWGQSAGASLTTRQREVLQLIAEGRSTKEIAGRLDVSVKTIETHRAQLMDRLGIHDVAGLVRAAMRAGLIPPES
jgi:DNA-binding NarL/FixJ family response regulator